MLISLLIGILLAALAYWLAIAVGLPAIVGIIAAILIFVAALGYATDRRL